MQPKVDIERFAATAVVRFERGKVNAIDRASIDLLRDTFSALASDRAVRSVIFTGAGKFFSFGFDVPALYDDTPEDFTRYLESFTGFCLELFRYPKPLVAAVNGHATAGGCMLANACDFRLMVSGRARISLNEITFGSTVFAGATEMLRFWAGNRNATRILTTGAMYSAEEALALGLIDEVTAESDLHDRAIAAAAQLEHSEAAGASVKSLLRGEVIDRIERAEPAAIREFVAIWYSEETRRQLKQITIR